jgi:hypothetical protein
MNAGEFDQKIRAIASARSRRFAVPAMLASLFGASKTVSAAAKGERGRSVPDLSTGEKVILEGKLMKQQWINRDDSPGAATSRRGNRNRIGIRSIYRAPCATYSGVWCVVSCPSGMQAIGGGLFSWDANGGMGPNAPTQYYNQWATWLYSPYGNYTSTTAYAVCMKP